MAIASIERPDAAAPGPVVVGRPPGHRRRRIAALFVATVVAGALAGLGSYRIVPADGSTTSASLDAWSRRLQGEADAYDAEQANIARGRAADSARLQAAADASARRVTP